MAFLKSKTNKYHATHPNVQQHINKFFHEVKVGDIDRSKNFECETMKDNMAKCQVWSLSPKDPTLYQYRQLFAFMKVVWIEILKPNMSTMAMCLNGY